MAAKKTSRKVATAKPRASKPRASKSREVDGVSLLREKALSYPGAFEDHPWGETVVKVGKKVFVFLGSHAEDGGWGASFKLPQSSGAALVFPFASPTGYGLGKAGWVSVSFPKGEPGPVPLLLEWLDESYRAIAPKTLVKRLG